MKIVLLTIIILFLYGCLWDPFKSEEGFICRQSTHFNLFYKKNSLIERDCNKILNFLEKDMEKYSLKLEIKYQKKVYIYLVETPTEIERGNESYGGCGSGFNRCVWAVYCDKFKIVDDGQFHEITHVIMNDLFGVPGVAFMSEGIAVALDADNGTAKEYMYANCDKMAKNMITSDPNLSLKSLPKMGLESKYYNIAGSFVKYLINKYGIVKYKEVYALCSSDNYEREFYKSYRKQFELLEKEWKKEILNQ